GGIGRWNDAADDAARAGDFNYIFCFGNDADRAQVLEIIPNYLGRELVLYLLVFGNAIAGLFDSQRRDPRRVAQRGLGHRVADAIDFGLIKTRDFGLSAMGGFD